MNKQDLRSFASCPGGEYSYSAPEISIFLAQESLDLGLEPEIDEHTGLPKLPIEPPAAGSPGHESPEVSHSSSGHRLASALRMSSNVSPSMRKSVTFNAESVLVSKLYVTMLVFQYRY
jgi:hypothetical protein